MNAHPTALPYQIELYELSTLKYPSLSKNLAIKEAFFEVPRHAFVQKFSIDGVRWFEVNQEVLESHLPILYHDGTLMLYEDSSFISTISQPSLVLRMIDLLDLKKGMRVFELGAGSGWNAALMGHLVGEEGRVISFEIIPEMTKRARMALSSFHLPQVDIRLGDGMVDLKHEKEFDRAIFTAGAYELPEIFFGKIKEGGKLIFVWKTMDVDYLLEMLKVADSFIIQSYLHCQFVPVKSPSQKNTENILEEVIPRVGMKWKKRDDGSTGLEAD